MINNNVRGRYVATNEDPLVLCSYGKTPASALRQMAKLLDEMDVESVIHGYVHYIVSDGLYGMTVYA
jgi:hypothetical protein